MIASDLRKAIDYVIYGFEQHRKIPFSCCIAHSGRDVVECVASKCKHMLHASHFLDENLLLIEPFSLFSFPFFLVVSCDL